MSTFIAEAAQAIFLAGSEKVIQHLSLDTLLLLSGSGNTNNNNNNATASGGVAASSAANTADSSYQRQKLLFVVAIALAHSVPFYALCLLYELACLVVPRKTLARWRYEQDRYPPRSLVLKAYFLTAVYHILSPVLMWHLGADAILSSNPKLLDQSAAPTTFELLKQLALCYLFTDGIFYFSHCLLHWERIYSYIHRQHHLFIQTVPVAAEFAHPIEWIFGNVFAVTFALVALRMHFSVWVIWLSVAMAGTTIAHSGINWCASLRDLQWHSFHHSHNVGNFGHSQLFDTLVGTKRAWIRYWSSASASSRADASANVIASRPSVPVAGEGAPARQPSVAAAEGISKGEAPAPAAKNSRGRASAKK